MNIRGWKQVYQIGGHKLVIAKMIDRIFGTGFDQRVYSSIAPERYGEIVKLQYRDLKGIELNLEKPKTFNEKINWLKLYDNNERKTKLADKYAVKEWVKNKIGEEYVIPLIGVWKSFDEIDFDALPQKFVLKCNHGCAWNIIVKDKNEFDISAARKKINKWMKTNYAYKGFELQYKDIDRRIIAEQYMEQLNGSLSDYKFHCFAGEPKLIEVMVDRVVGTHKAKQAVMKTDWTMNEGISLYTYDRLATAPEKPKGFEEMMRVARELSIGFPYVRVDLYDLNGKVLFGEMTFTPANGTDPTDEHFIYADLIDIEAINKR